MLDFIDLPQVGEKIKSLLIESGFSSPQDLLWHLPRQYENKTQLIPISQLRIGQRAYFCGYIQQVEVTFAPRRMLKCVVGEAHSSTPSILLRFFYFNKHQVAQLKAATKVACYGEVRLVGKHLEVAHPEYQVLAEDEAPHCEPTLTPIYPKLAGLTEKRLRKIVQLATETCLQRGLIKELLPSHLLNNPQWFDVATALSYLHFPRPESHTGNLIEGTSLAHQRLALEELIAHRLSLYTVKAKRQAVLTTAFTQITTLPEMLVQSLPYPLTSAQKRVVKEIFQDLKSRQPMQRLLQGDVGSGKTLVAFFAALHVIDHGYQVALMAPTEILAEQHFESAQQLLSSLHIHCTLLVSKLSAPVKRERLAQVASGHSQLIIGTHALFQDAVKFDQLGLIIVDEQHRFGVKQRKALLDKAGGQPHQLMMTATPIPRTLAMSFYADLDVSTIDELPPGRTPIKTTLVAQSKREQVITRIHHAVQAGRQVYWVCPLIEESEALTCQAAEKTYEKLQQELPHLKVDLVHGRLKPHEKQIIMQKFAAHQLDILVATTVIEVGVNVPNASIMIIENAERMGLAQLHQLRGRVGRGSVESFCVLLYESALSKVAQERLALMRDCQDGFVIAEKDLEIRGPGEYLGTRQTGDLHFKIAHLQHHSHLLTYARELADEIIRHHPHLVEPLIQRWLGNKQMHYCV